jgi:diguanylate cyclase (GGDEF)-like protein
VSEARPSSLTEQMQRGFHALRFGGDLEIAYRQGQFRDYLRYIRLNLGILAIIGLEVVQVDHVVLPVISWIMPDLARTGVMVSVLLGGFAVTYLPRADIWYPRYMAGAMMIALMGIAWIGLMAWGQGEPRVFVRLVIATVAVYFVLGLPFRSALVVNLVTIAFYAVAAYGKSMPAAEMTHHLSMLLLINVICIAGAYKLEHTRRTAWLEGQMLAEVAMQDGLTGIPNRRRFDDHLERVWAQSIRERKHIALLFADIDHFKLFNDRYGHQAGDEALKAVASVLTSFARRPLDLAARYGGEEFAIVLFDTNRDHAVGIAEEIMAAVRDLAIPHAGSGAARVLTISIGIACVVPAAKRTWEGLVQLADQALYAAKDAGRNQACVQEAEYEHMKTGYFQRHQTELGGPDKPKSRQ